MPSWKAPQHVLLTSTRSFAALNLRDLCWFILARGATPEQQMTTSLQTCLACTAILHAKQQGCTAKQ